jgi:hypothetical protein
VLEWIEDAPTSMTEMEEYGDRGPRI